MTTKREQIIDAACQLMERQGYHATGLNQILTESGAPKGSLYYYFPGGKLELTIEAIDRSSQIIAGHIREVMAAVDDVAEAVKVFIMTLAEHVQASGYQQGGPITAIALEAASADEQLRVACRDAYDLWQSIFEAKLRRRFDGARAKQLAALIISSIEGAIILSRSQRSTRPLKEIAVEIENLLEYSLPG